jgi:hypothetical protein
MAKHLQVTYPEKVPEVPIAASFVGGDGWLPMSLQPSTVWLSLRVQQALAVP